MCWAAFANYELSAVGWYLHLLAELELLLQFGFGFGLGCWLLVVD
jgi:hypothetical protein